YTRALLDAVPSTTGPQSPNVLGGEPPDPTAIPTGCRFHPRCPLRRTLSEEAAARCLDDVPVLHPNGEEHLAACPHTATASSLRGDRDRPRTAPRPAPPSAASSPGRPGGAADAI